MSALAEAMNEPSVAKASAVTRCWCPEMPPRLGPRDGSQSLTVPSWLAVASREPLAANAQLTTLAV